MTTETTVESNVSATGDNSNMMVYAAVMLAALLGLTGWVANRRKKNY